MSSKDRILDPDGDLILILTDRVIMYSLKDDEDYTNQTQIRVQCSSKHLTLASSVFNVMLSEKFKEGTVLRSTGTLTLPLPDDDPAALLLLLCIMHGQTEEIPLTIDLYMLTRIAIIVDKYQLHKMVQMCTRIWTKEVNIQKEDTRRWIFISWVFQWPTHFTNATQLAMSTTTSRIDESSAGDIDLPIPLSIVENIDQHRQQALSQIIDGLQGILERYQGPVLTCTMICDSTVLGSLTKTMKSLQILIPPEPPYSKLSFESFAKVVRNIKIWTHHCPKPGPTPKASIFTEASIFAATNRCPNEEVKEKIENLLINSEQRLCGLALQ